MQVMVQKKRPPPPAGAPPDLVGLMERCWSHDPAARPSFEAIKGWLAGGAAPASPAASAAALYSPEPSQLSIVGEEPATITQTQRFMALEVPPGAQPGRHLER